MKALLIAGDARFFSDEISGFRTFLRKKVGLTNIQTIRTAYLTTKQMQDKLEAALDPETADGPFLLLYCYCGHGWNGEWGISFQKGLCYPPLAQLLKDYPEPIMFINDCCHAYSIVTSFGEVGVSPEKVSLISAAEGKIGPGLAGKVLGSWRQKKVHETFWVCTERVTIRFNGPPIEGEEDVISFGEMVEEHEVLPPEEQMRGALPEKRWGVELDHLFFPA